MIINMHNSVTFDPHWKKMIGDKELTTDEAYKEWIKFLKGFKYYDFFLSNMRKYFGNNCFMYKKYFSVYTSYMTECVNTKDYGRPYWYYWTMDRHLIKPFTYTHAFREKRRREIDVKLMEISKMWEHYCSDKKLTYSMIIPDKKDDYTDIRGCSWEKILEECDYPVPIWS